MSGRDDDDDEGDDSDQLQWQEDDEALDELCNVEVDFRPDVA